MTFAHILTHERPFRRFRRPMTEHATLASATKDVLAAGDDLRAALRVEAAFRRQPSDELDDEARIRLQAARGLVDCALEKYSAATQRLVGVARRLQ